MLRTKILSKQADPIRYSPSFTSNLDHLIQSVREHKLEGLIAKRRHSRYEPGQRSGAWLKVRVNQQHKFVIGGYTPSPKTFDALLFGCYENGKLTYVGRTRNGFHARTPGEPVSALAGIADREVSICESARNENWALGLRINGGKDGGVPLVEAGARWAV